MNVLLANERHFFGGHYYAPWPRLSMRTNLQCTLMRWPMEMNKMVYSLRLLLQSLNLKLWPMHFLCTDFLLSSGARVPYRLGRWPPNAQRR